MTLRGYMDVITRTTFHLQARIRCGTDDEAETGPESETAPGRSRPRNQVHTDSMSFNEFHWGDFGVSFIATVAGFYTWG